MERFQLKSWVWVATGLAMLLFGSLLDNARGPLMPVIRESLGFSHADVSWLLVAGNLGAAVFSFLLIPLAARFGEKRIALFSCALAVLGTSYAYLVQGFWSFLVLATLVGSAIATLGAVANLLVISGSGPELQSRFLSALHMMYGVGSLLAPLITTALLAFGLSWRGIFASIAPFVLALFGFIIARLRESEVASAIELEPRTFDRSWTFGIFAFAIYVCAEALTSLWMVTYLVEAHHMELAKASSYLTVFFVCMALSRGLCFLSLKPHHEKRILTVCIGCAILFSFLGRVGYVWLLPLSGLVGPYFPLMLSRTTRRHAPHGRAVALWIITGMQISLAPFNYFIGKLADIFGIGATYWCPFVLFLFVAVFTFMLLRDPSRGE